MSFTPKEEKMLRVLIRMTEEGSSKFAIVPFVSRFYLKEPRPDNWRSSMIQGLRTLSLKLKGSGSHITKVSGRGRGKEAYYEFFIHENTKEAI